MHWPKGTLFCTSVVLLVAGLLPAQEVTVGAVHLLSSESAPDQLPAPMRPLLVNYPEELKGTNEEGLVILYCHLDEDGHGVFNITVGTAEPFSRAVQAAATGWQFTAARRGGADVPAIVWIPIIFRPRPNDAGIPDAPPRVLEFAPVILKKPPTETASPVVPVKVTIDTEGRVRSATPQIGSFQQYAAAFDAALSQWRFAPARRAGKAVPTETVVPVLLLVPLTNDSPTQPARLIRGKSPVYPFPLRRLGIEGEVLVDFVVDEHGAVQNAYVVRSSDHDFDEAAIGTVRQWRFRPAEREGKPVPSHQQVPIVFSLNSGKNDGKQERWGVDSPMSIYEPSDPSKLPPELQFDTPPKLRNAAIPVYPYSARKEKATGTAKVTMVINRLGNVSAVKIVKADRPEFGLALAAAVQEFKFEPAKKDGRPVPHLLNFEQRFDEDELPDEAGHNLLRVEKKHPEQIVPGQRLDSPVKSVSVKTFYFPVTVDQSVEHGRAVIEVLIDEDGWARLPRIVEASDPAFGYAAMQALNGWAFEAPKQGGKKCIGRVRIPVVFNRDHRPASAPQPETADPAAQR